MTVMEPVNLFADEWDGGRDRPGWKWRRLDVGGRLGAELLGASLYELAPGEKTFPYHWHHAEEEWLLVLAGRPTLRSPEGEQELRPGDAVAFRRGPEGAHLVRNDTAEPARLLILSSEAEVEVAEYPDSGKVGVFSKHRRLLVREDAGVDYFDGED
ncbi:MAG: cupin domain-containing protein [Actinobacteria bacterium]|nr:cupin domain-containing protein [Actinomycetota bacterium]